MIRVWLKKEVIFKGSKRDIESEEVPKTPGQPVDDSELFTRLLYFGAAHLGSTEEVTWLTLIGFLLVL